MALDMSPNMFSIFQNIFLVNDTSNITNNDTIPYVSEENKNEGYLYLLIIDLIIFFGLTYTTHSASKSLEAKKEQNEVPALIDFRKNFIKLLVLANGIRTLSLLFIIIIQNPNGNNGISWVNSILHIAPAFLFVSSYLYFAIYLSETFYDYISYRNHLLKPALIFIVNCGYLFLGIIALITLLLKYYKVFFYISELLMAILYLILGSVIIYFGNALSKISQNRNTENFQNYSSFDLKNFVTYIIGGLFLLKGVSGVIGGIGAYDPDNHNIYDFFWFLILEVLPTVIFLESGKNGNKERKSELDLENVSQRMSSIPRFERES
jgi:hypothetical protein